MTFFKSECKTADDHWCFRRYEELEHKINLHTDKWFLDIACSTSRRLGAVLAREIEKEEEACYTGN